MLVMDIVEMLGEIVDDDAQTIELTDMRHTGKDAFVATQHIFGNGQTALPRAPIMPWVGATVL
ncbi:hypothetical protein D3C84_1126100 [compost metagenome]